MSYFDPPLPFIEPRLNDTSWHNQKLAARKLLALEGPIKLNNPHAMIGRECGCNGCFCCAAEHVMRDWVRGTQRLRHRKAKS